LVRGSFQPPAATSVLLARNQDRRKKFRCLYVDTGLAGPRNTD